jgi:hypothetical protein
MTLFAIAAFFAFNIALLYSHITLWWDIPFLMIESVLLFCRMPEEVPADKICSTCAERGYNQYRTHFWGIWHINQQEAESMMGGPIIYKAVLIIFLLIVLLCLIQMNAGLSFAHKVDSAHKV